MRIGNALYETVDEIPSIVPVFPLSGALLLPRAHLPLNIFEPRYVKMIDDVMAGDRVIGMVQPRFGADADDESVEEPALCQVGALGRIVSYQESGDGRYLIQLGGVCRFTVLEELPTPLPYRKCRISAERFKSDLLTDACEADVDRDALIRAFQSYLDANDLEADWKSVRSASNEALVNTLAMMSPYGPAEKQALLEAPDLAARAATLVAITEMEVARQSGDEPVLN
ncbi:LON peptidase substrate-binding domain-containing protein [Acuticoccus sp. I52.16.1]|uniref:LON peptidase substrate-binding domain-containing protein n=1 Tax=Acuticoccus sp. I52.16.1 TaxID=2928472 RepID=UPI001FD4BC54|nr:LON peptidase substrate-binding domain-containing protein [Acuticoccus sp. I52.16.1]UOM36414.1 LON peptidase substrate-binding domain-containing protein [Acuticoccus sp. I52.16.1]